jgi:SAM-dependent methyltransferase
MARHSQSLDAAYFEEMFQGDTDPWDLESSAYEAAKFEASVAALGGRHYRRGFEIGCAGGTLTRRLAPWTADLLAIDISATALERARKRCEGLTQVRFARMAFPRDTPDEPPFDLMVMSEVAYYWDEADLDRAARDILRLLEPGGDLLLVHFTGETDYPQSGDDAVGLLGAALGGDVEVLTSETHARYRLDLWRRR